MFSTSLMLNMRKPTFSFFYQAGFMFCKNMQKKDICFLLSIDVICPAMLEIIFTCKRNLNLLSQCLNDINQFRKSYYHFQGYFYNLHTYSKIRNMQLLSIYIHLRNIKILQLNIRAIKMKRQKRDSNILPLV